MTKESSKDERKHVKKEKSKSKKEKERKSKHDETKSRKDKKKSHDEKSKKHSRHSKTGHDDKRPDTDAPSYSSKDAITVSQPITVDDHFFTKNEHFRVWLRMHRKKKSGVDNNYEAFTSEQCRNIFSEEFAPAYNAGLLPALFYQEDIPLELRVDAKVGTRTQHKWGFLRKLTENDKVQLSDLAEDVEMQTRNAKQAEHSSVVRHPTAINSSSSSSSSSAGLAGADSHHLSRNTQSYCGNSSSNSNNTSSRHEEKKRLNSMYSQEILPPKELDGRLRMLDQRKAVADKLHGAHQQKEEDRDGLSGVSEAYLLGGGSDFQAALLHRQQAAERKRSKLNERAQELASKQADRDAQWIQQLGIDPSKGRMTIKPREP